MTKSRPKTGERRVTNQPLKIDRLSPAVHDAILFLYNSGKTWQEIEALSAEPFGKGKSGFVEWEKLPTPVLELFPDMRLPHSTLHRWHDLRVRQVKAQVLAQSEQARQVAQAFASAAVDGASEAVLNATRDLIFSLIADGASSVNRLKIAAKLTSLAEVMQTVRANDIKERKVSAEERKLKMMERREALAVRKLESEAEKLKKVAEKRPITAEDLDRLRQRTFGLPPVAKKEG